MIPPSEKEARIADRACRALPAATVFVGMVLMAIPFPLAIGAMPHFALLMVIIWSSVQPRLMPAWLAFVLGFLFDLVAGLPLGPSSLIFALAVAMVRYAESRMEVRSLGLDWTMCTLLITVLTLLSWQLATFVGLSVPLWPMFVQAGTTILAYPVAVAAAAWLQDRILRWTA